jgi:TM2 domain-containing membrane protein YozV
MDTLSLNTAEPRFLSSEPAPLSEVRKRPGLAFFLSLLFPGLGHVYCRKVKAGIIIAAFFSGCILVLGAVDVSEQSLYWGIAARGAIVLYGFAFLDAFYSAREINAGIDNYIIGTNPRVAAMLNLLTAGFGYFYVGERGKGIAWFLVSRVVVGAGASRSPAIALLVEVVCAVVAVDAFRLARKQLRETLPAESLDQFAMAGKGLTPVVPLVLAVILVINYFLFCSLGLFLPKYQPLRWDHLAITQTPEGETIEHRLYHVGMKLPPGWRVKNSSEEFVIAAFQPETGCNVGLMMHPNLPFHGQQALAREVEEVVKKESSSYHWLSEGPSRIGSKSAYLLEFEATYSTIPVVEKMFFLQRGLTLYSFVEASSQGAAGICGSDMDRILESIKLDF